MFMSNRSPQPHQTATEAAEAFRPPWDSALLRNAVSALYDGDRLLVDDGWIVRLSTMETRYEEIRTAPVVPARRL